MPFLKVTESPQCLPARIFRGACLPDGFLFFIGGAPCFQQIASGLQLPTDTCGLASHMPMENKSGFTHRDPQRWEHSIEENTNDNVSSEFTDAPPQG